MRARLVIAIAGLLAGAAVIAAVVVLSGGDDAAAESGSILAWDEKPLLITPDELPDDRIAYGTVRNTSLERIQAPADDFAVRDAAGNDLDASVQFLGTYAHGLYGAFQQPDNIDVMQLSRLGIVANLETGQTSPLTVSYRLGKGAEVPVTLFYRDVAALELPAD